jgi:hypothetical protein
MCMQDVYCREIYEMYECCNNVTILACLIIAETLKLSENVHFLA